MRALCRTVNRDSRADAGGRTRNEHNLTFLHLAFLSQLTFPF
jgi:hypothetical protein